MSAQHHMSHDHSAHVRAQGGAFVHEPAATARDSYAEAYSSAHPEPGGRVIAVALEASEVEWPIAAGATIQAWAFNGQVPGPVIEGRVGDVLEVTLSNRLPEPTAIHWHGLRLPASMDGTEMVQRLVQPGESFTYRFKLLDAGTFWYHPHANETVQLERGLYGALIVRGDGEPTLDREQVLVLDDIKLDRHGRIAKFGGFVQWHDGREGNARLVNGNVEPTFTIAAGQIERWRVVNASSARYVRLAIGRAPFHLLGTDGGLLEAPVLVQDVLLAPGDRADIAVGPFAEGQEVAVEALRYWRTTIKRRKDERFASLRVGKARPSVARLPERLRVIEPLAPASATPNRTVDFGIKYSLRRGMDFVVNGERHDVDEPVKIGELQVWDVVNSTLMDHPFHLHGYFFQVLSVNGEPPAWRSWEDVVNLPPKSTTRIAWLPDERPGSWMYHCHILEHHAAGMMAHFDVVR
jgi:FtsP/CotA-like multicopper oxidase with cupredoxin domain